MKHIIRLMIWGAVILSVAAAIAADPAPSPTDAEARQLHDQLEQLSVLHRQRASEAASQQRQITQVQHQIDRLKGDLSVAETELARQRLTVTELQTKRAQQQKLIDDSTATLASLARTALPPAQSLRARIQQGIPFRLAERLASLDIAIEGLQSNRPEPQSTGLGNLWALLSEHAQLSLTTQLWNEPVTLGDRRIHSYLIRLGLVAQMMVSEDGRTIGIAGPNSAGQWKTDLDPAITAKVKKALDILQQHTPPEITPVPLLPAPGSSIKESR